MSRLSNRSLRDREQGFTLVELLVVVIIIGILAAVAIPLFLDQRKLATDASVKSDVRNTATQVQTWLATNPGQIATDATDYAGKGGKMANSTGNTVNLSVATDGSYLVCGHAGTAGKQYTASSAAYVYDSTSGKFGLGSCTGGIVGAGSSAAPTTSSPAAPALGALGSSAESGEANNAYWYSGSSASGGPLGASGYSTAVAKSGVRSVIAPTNAWISYKPTFIAGKTYTVTAYSYRYSGSQPLQMYVYDTGAGWSSANLAANSTTSSWVQTQSLTFVAKSTTFIDFGGNTSANGYFDDLAITQVN